MGFRFIHAADLHLDAPYHGLGRAPAEIREALRDASLDAFDRIVELAIALDAAFVVLAGDIYAGPEHGLRAQRRFLAGLQRLSSWTIDTFIACGGRDPLQGWSAIPAWPRGVTVFGTGGVEAATAVRHGERLATVYGMSYPHREVEEDLSSRFVRGDGDGIHIAVLHADATGADPGCSPCSVGTLRERGMDYWALGHLHTGQVLRADQPWVVYPGTHQGRGNRADEIGPKGVMVVSVEGDTIRPPEFVPVDRVRFLRLEVDIREMTDVGTLRAALLDRAAALRAEHEGRGLVVTGTVGGRGPLRAELARTGALEELLRDLRDATGESSPFFWWDALRDATQPNRDRNDIRRRADFTAEVLRLKEELAADPRRLRGFVAERLGAAQHGALARLAPEPAAQALAELLDEAELLALDLLEE